MVSCRRETGDVRRLAARDESDGGRRGKPEEALDPTTRDLLGHGRERAQRRERPVLVPGDGEYLGRQRRRQGSTGDEAEVSWARRRDGRHLPEADQIPENIRCLSTIVCETDLDRLPHFGNVQFCPNRSISEGVEIPTRRFGNLREQI